VWATVRTKGICIQIEGCIPSALLEVLRDEYGLYLILRVAPIGEMVDIMHAPLYQLVQKQFSPGRCLKVFRQDRCLTQKELGETIWSRRPISRKMMFRLAGFFEVSAESFLE
jgi:hypothetical protein